MSLLAYETCKTCERQVYNGTISKTAGWLEFQIFDTTPHICRCVQTRHTSASRVGSLDAQEPDAFYGDLRSLIWQLSVLQSSLQYARGVLYKLVRAWLSCEYEKCLVYYFRFTGAQFSQQAGFCRPNIVLSIMNNGLSESGTSRHICIFYTANIKNTVQEPIYPGVLLHLRSTFTQIEDL